jgi:hypothetical protein
MLQARVVSSTLPSVCKWRLLLIGMLPLLLLLCGVLLWLLQDGSECVSHTILCLEAEW